MPKQPKPKPVGRPKLPKGNAKAGYLRVRLTAEELRKIEAMAKANKQTVSEWVRSELIGGQ
jgi:hypothetical protein